MTYFSRSSLPEDRILHECFSSIMNKKCNLWSLFSALVVSNFLTIVFCYLGQLEWYFNLLTLKEDLLSYLKITSQIWHIAHGTLKRATDMKVTTTKINASYKIWISNMLNLWSTIRFSAFNVELAKDSDKILNFSTCNKNCHCLTKKSSTLNQLINKEPKSCFITNFFFLTTYINLKNIMRKKNSFWRHHHEDSYYQTSIWINKMKQTHAYFTAPTIFSSLCQSEENEK